MVAEGSGVRPLGPCRTDGHLFYVTIGAPESDI